LVRKNEPDQRIRSFLVDEIDGITNLNDSPITDPGQVQAVYDQQGKAAEVNE
jgi:hypothetical protein